MEEEHYESDATRVAEITSEELQKIVSSRDRKALVEVFEHVPTIDIAEAADDFEPQDLIYIFQNVESNFTAEFFDDLSQDTKESLIKAMTDKDLVQLVNEQSADDIVDTIGDMPANLVSRVLKAADKEMRKDINVLLKFKEGTAGSLMTTEYLEFINTMSVEDCIEAIRTKGKDAETIYTIFVRNKSRQFVGTVNLDDLIFAQKDQKLDEIMNEDVVTVSTQTDQEEVGQIFRRYDLNAMAVLNDDNRLVGIITIDDAVDVITEEQNEDLARLTNMEPTDKPYTEMTAWDNAKKCFPWLIALLILGTFTTMVLNRLEHRAIFTSLSILIAFVPTLMDTGGNAGGQTTGLMIRALALDNISPKDVLKVWFKEFKSALIVAAFTAGFAFLWITIEQYTGIVNIGAIQDANGNLAVDLSNQSIWAGNCWNYEFFSHAIPFAGLVATTMFVAIVVSKSVGTLLPLGAAAIKKDPALLSQPMLTTIMDVLTLVIYFAIACAFFPAYAG